MMHKNPCATFVMQKQIGEYLMYVIATCSVIGWAQRELTPSKKKKMGPDLARSTCTQTRCKDWCYGEWILA